MISELNKQDHKKYLIVVNTLLAMLFIAVLTSLAIGQYKMSLSEIFKSLSNILFKTQFNVDPSAEKIVHLIRLPRTIAALIVGSCLAVAGGTFQSTFNNKLVSPDVLGVSAGACVGAAVSILIGLGSYFVGLFAFAFGIISVFLALLLPKLFKSNKAVTLVLSGIIVGSLMNSFIGLIKFIADKDDKIAEITFWMMGSLAGVTFKEIFTLLPIYIIAIISLVLLRWKINIISLGEIEAKTLGENYRLFRFLIIIFSTCLTAVSVSLSGNIGWVGLVIPHISRSIVGNDNRYSLTVSGLLGGLFMLIVDIVSRNLTINEIPLSIITGLMGSLIYTIVLIRKGRELNE